MKILAFDTTSDYCSVSLIKDNVIAYQISDNLPNNHAEKLVPNIEIALSSCNLSYYDLNLVAVTNGPGSFTGVRIGLTSAKIIKIITNVDTICLNGLEVIAYPYRFGMLENFSYKEILVIKDARLNEYSMQKFRINNNSLMKLSEILLVTKSSISSFVKNDNLLVLTDSDNLTFQENKNILLKKINRLKSNDLALLAKEKFHKKDLDYNLSPIYVRLPNISKRKK